MAIIHEYDAITDSNVEIEISATELATINEGIENTTIADIEAAKKIAKDSAVAKLSALGLSEDEIKAITS
jgi:hypothetical protein